MNKLSNRKIMDAYDSDLTALLYISSFYQNKKKYLSIIFSDKNYKTRSMTDLYHD